MGSAASVDIRSPDMDSTADLLERRIPDAVSTGDLADAVAVEIDFLAGRSARWCNALAVSPGLRARALVASGHPDLARTLLDEFDVARVSVQELAAVSWAVSRVGPAGLARALLDLVESRAEKFLVDEVPLGPTKSLVGLLRSTLGDLDGAVEAFEEAAFVGDARAPVWGALARLELSRVWRCRAAVADRSAATEALGAAEQYTLAARTFLIAGGYQALIERANHDAAVVGTFLQGDRWTVGVGVEPAVTIRSSKGLSLLHYLLANRGRAVSAVELKGVLDGADAGELAALASVKLLGKGDANGSDVTTELREVLFDDAVRSRVSKLVNRTITKVAKSHRLLGSHLASAVSTGHACQYEPAGVVEISWNLYPSNG